MPVVATVRGEQSSVDVVDLGADLASAYDDTLVVVAVMTDEEYRTRRREREDPDGKARYSVADARTTLERRARDVVADAGTALADDAVEVRGRVGEVHTEVLAVGDEVDARFVVVGGRRRSPTGKAVFGDATQRLLLEADRPVVTIMNDE
jgi:nucleotide-binding universal stress UspA family protein